MPFYEYECQACKYYTEVMQKISDAPLSKCPSCGKRALKKLVSAPVFRLKGGGWYETDFKSEKESKRNLLEADKEEPKAAASEAPAKESKDAAEGKQAKGDKEAKPATTATPSGPPAASGATAAGAEARSARSGTTPHPKVASRSAPRRPARTAARKSARKRRR